LSLKLSSGLLACAVLSAQPSIINAVRARLAQHDLAGAESLARAYQAQAGATPQLAAAISWLARGAFDAKSYDRADALATEASTLTARFLTARKLDADAYLPTAQGAAIEVHAQVLAARGERAEAIVYLREQAARFAGASIGERIHKNINLLSLEGKRAPALEVAEWLGPRPQSLAALRGHPVLLFFWAHWCPDCKGMIADLAKLRQEFASRGLVLVGPTRLYGSVAQGEEAPPEKEKAYIEQVRNQYYAALADMPAPLSAANFVTYGASSTPTLVLIDRAGIVRYYHPGAVAADELAAKIRSVVK
jgi:thiol-disulfide isomerase/thioredoxin